MLRLCSFRLRKRDWSRTSPDLKPGLGSGCRLSSPPWYRRGRGGGQGRGPGGWTSATRRSRGPSAPGGGGKTRKASRLGREGRADYKAPAGQPRAVPVGAVQLEAAAGGWGRESGWLGAR